ncbi:hypothetical protein Mgra_00006924 [Meloidogyne graminicola]|uniref:SPRY domain-containing protein n=1 Tax=Meloidogyne graminicola TaxID=189291 RepID=A0A8S9ZJU0_9BILA|nr:hypothetical protein Mgra_00006924 [Meloidogyne graminicola]
MVTIEDFVELKNKFEEMAFELKQIKEGKRVRFVFVPNKWKIIDSYKPCCENKCINTDRPNGYCIEGNGFIQIKSNTNIKYIECRDGENQFNKPKENSALSQCCFNCLTYSLFYYEIKFQRGEASCLGLGFKKDQEYVIRLWSKEIWYKDKKISLPSFIIKTDDIIGCGLVYPPNNKLPYFFFTKNGKQIGKAVLLEKNYEYLQPYVGLECCSIETNFGEDLNSKPFMYDVSKHCVIEEFYKEEEFSSK